MDNDKLSQEEINALLQAAGTSSEKKSDGDAPPILSEMEMDAIGELGNISMGSAATAISTLLGKRVEITTPSVEETDLSDAKEKFKGKKVIVRVDYTTSLNGTNAFILDPHVVAIISDIMMGGSGENVSEELDEIKLSAVGEAMNQMMGSAATALSEVIKKPVDISPPQVEEVDFDAGNVDFPPVFDEEKVVEVHFKMKVGDLAEGDMMQLMSPSFAKQFASFLTNTLPSEMGKEENKPASAEEKQVTMPSPTPQKEKKPSQPAKKAEFQELEEEKTTVPSNKLEALLDIPLDISVELGRTNMTLKQVLDLGSGSLIELDKLTGEPVDILVNGKVIAEGEVVVIGENFGIRITKILSKKERLYSLK
jgi:flagellar motor switch protein FliN/FliY